jgi:hypothetical protein
MLEIDIKSPVGGSSTFADSITVEYECRGTLSNLRKLVFLINGVKILKEDFYGFFDVENLQEENVLTVYGLNKKNQKILNSEKTIFFQKKTAKVNTETSIEFFGRELLPEYIKTNYHKFSLFIQKYYEYLKQSNDPSIVPFAQDSYVDVDSTPDYFLEQFYSQFLPDFPREFAIDRQTGTELNIRNVIKNIKKFYESKGTQKSFEFLFRMFYDTEIELFYPRTLIHNTSAGKWTQKKSIKVFSFNENISNKTYNNTIYQLNEEGKKVAFAKVIEVQLYRLENYKIAEFFIEDSFGTFQKERKIYCDIFEDGSFETIEFYPVYCIDKININLGGYNYEVNDRVILVSKDSIVIDGLEINDDPTEINIVEGGLINLDFSEPEVTMIDGGFFGFEFVNEISTFDYLKGKGFLGRVSKIGDKGQILEIQILNFGFNYDIFSPSGYDVVVQSENGVGFNGIPSVGVICNYFPYYSGSSGILGKNNVLQDNFYYQSHSYEIRSDINLPDYESKILKLVHPSGYKLFGKYKIVQDNVNEYESDLSLINIQTDIIEIEGGDVNDEFDPEITVNIIDNQEIDNEPEDPEYVFEGQGI